VHSLDAAHLIRVVNTSVAAEITDVLTVHDSFACHATNARRFREIICDQFATMYSVNDLILQLRHRNAFKVSELLPNPKGTLAPNVVRGAEYAWM
jgi:DNA-directed RNA polymerase